MLLHSRLHKCADALINYKNHVLWSHLDRWRSMSIILKLVVTVGQPLYVHFLRVTLVINLCFNICSDDYFYDYCSRIGQRRVF